MCGKKTWPRRGANDARIDPAHFVEHSPSVEPFADGLKTLADFFGKDGLRAAEARKMEGSEFV